MPLDGILKTEPRIMRYHSGDIIVREGDYGNSAFLTLEGTVRVVLAPGLPRRMLGRQRTARKGVFEALSQVWTNRRVPEVRDLRRDGHVELPGVSRRGEATKTRTFLQDVPAILDDHRTAQLGPGSLFGELAALGRVPRTATVFAETAAVLLEIRWQGLRELRRYDRSWRRQIDESYRKNALKTHLQEVPYFAGLAPETLQSIADVTLFETFGSFDWHTDYKRLRQQDKLGSRHEPVLAREGDYADGLALIRAGFARVSVKLGEGERTLTYLGASDDSGLYELYPSGPGCMLGCRTGASSREIDRRTGVINAAPCVGCATCANSCPYDNIRMVEIRDLAGQPVIDVKSRRPILKATKCDLCASNPGGPACVRACAHDALQRVDFRDLAQVGVRR